MLHFSSITSVMLYVRHGSSQFHSRTLRRHPYHWYSSSIGGLHPPGARGNFAMEDVLYALRDSPYSPPGDLVALVDKLGCDDSSRVARAIRTRREREVKL
jgi:hypothetical protein